MSEDQLISLAALRLVRERGPGWTEAWGELYVLLEERVGIMARSRSGWPDPVHDVDDFVADYMLGLQRKANEGTLLAAWDEEASVVGFLTAIVPRRMLSFLARRSREIDVHALVDGLDEYQSMMGASRSVRKRFAELFEDLVIEVPPGKIKRPVEQAGLQLHPRLNWRRAEHESLRAHLSEVIVHDDCGWMPRRFLLNDEHAAAESEIRRRLDGYSERLDDLHRGRGEKTVRELERKVDEAILEYHFSPLSAERLVPLLGLASVNNGDQLRSRYRKALPALLPGLRAAYERVLNLDPEDSDPLADEEENPS